MTKYNQEAHYGCFGEYELNDICCLSCFDSTECKILTKKLEDKKC